MFNDLIKSTTIWGIMGMVAAFAPGGVTDPIWGLLATAGMPSEWVEWAQLGVFLAGTFVALRGRIVAAGPLGVKS